MNNNSERGSDDRGKQFNSIQDLWQQELSSGKWYQKGDQYWKKIEPTINGVLGGLDFLHKIDIDSSNELLQKLFKTPEQPKRAIDCGAGIGRISKDLLTKWFQTVDLVDQCPAYVEKAKSDLGDKVQNYYCAGLQEFKFQHKYDCIWIQWVASHLTDDDLVSFLKDCKSHLTQDGYIVVKENILYQGFHLDTEDYSVVRSDNMFQKLFNLADLKIVMAVLQPNFPQNLYKVNQYVLQ